MKRLKRKVYYACLVSLFLMGCAVSTSAEIAVDFGGDYRDATLNAPDYSVALESGDYDFGANAIDDRRGYRSMDSFLMTVRLYGIVEGTPGSNDTFSAGVQIANFDSASDPSVAWIRYNAISDTLQIINAAGTSDMGLAFNPNVKKTDFLNGLNDANFILSFENAAGSANFVIEQLTGGNLARAIVQSGSDWYVSDTGLANSGSFSVNGYTETWYPYDPSINQFLDTASLGAGVSGSTLTNIQAFGAMMQGLHFDGTSAAAAVFQLEELGANMVQSAAPSSLAIDFGGDYNDLNQNNTEALTVGLGDYDFGANAIDDYAARREITDTFVTIDNVNGLTNKTTIFFGGAQYVNFDNSVTAPVVTQSNYKWRGASDQFFMLFDGENKTADSGFATATYVKKAGFVNGFDSISKFLAFKDEADSVSFTIESGPSMARALVQNGSDWYVSDTAIASGSFGVNGYNETWHPYDPSSNLFLDESSLGVGVAGSTFLDIQAAGVLMQKLHFDGTASTPIFKFNNMLLKVADADVETTVQMITDDFNRADTAWSSNGSGIRSDWVVPSSINLWRINGNTLEADPPNLLAAGDTPIMYNDSLQLSTVDGSSFTMSADVTATTNEQWCGVVFNYQNPANYCMVRFKSGIAAYHYIVVVDGLNAATSFNYAPVNFEAGTAYTFTVSGAASAYTIEITETGTSTVMTPVTIWVPEVTLSGGYTGFLAPDGNLDVEMVPDVIFDNFSLTVTIPVVETTFDVWISGFSVGSQTNLLDDFDADGMNNLVEFALGGDPITHDAASILPVSYLDDTGASNLFAYVYNRRLGADGLGLTYTVERDTDLVSTPEGWTTNGVTEADSVVLDSEFEEVTTTVPADVDQRFIRLKIGKQ